MTVNPSPSTESRNAPSLSRRLLREARLRVAGSPFLYKAYARAAGLPFQITRKTTLVVDSFPRSGNSFFEAALTRAHEGRLDVAHHSHAAGQVLEGVRRGIPCVVLVREPEGAVASFFEMGNGDYSVTLCTREYTAFYRALVPVIDQLIIVDTAAIESRFFDLMTHLKTRFGLPVVPYRIDGAVRSEIFAAVDETGRSRNGFSAEKYSETLSDEEKQARRQRLEAIRERIRGPGNASYLKDARLMYERFVSKAF